MPDFHHHLGDFSHLFNEEIRGQIWLQVSLSVLRAIFNPHLREELGNLVGLMFQLRQQRTGLEYVRTILYYLSKAAGKISRQDLQRVLLQQGADREELMNTIAQEFIQQGIQQGMQQGIEAMRQNVLELLQMRLDVPMMRFQARLNQVNDLDSLRLLVRRTATVDDITQFEQALAVLQMPEKQAATGRAAPPRKPSLTVTSPVNAKSGIFSFYRR